MWNWRPSLFSLLQQSASGSSPIIFILANLGNGLGWQTWAGGGRNNKMGMLDKAQKRQDMNEINSKLHMIISVAQKCLHDYSDLHIIILHNVHKRPPACIQYLSTAGYGPLPITAFTQWPGFQKMGWGQIFC